MVTPLTDIGGPPALLDGEGRAEPSAVVAAVAAAPLGTVQATILSDRLVVSKAFIEADNMQTMGSAWKFTAEYVSFLGRKGHVTDVSPGGAVRIKFEEGSVLWFPAGAVAQFLLPGGSPPSKQELATAVQTAPQSVLASTVQSLLVTYPQLSDFIAVKLQNGCNANSGGYSSAAGSAAVSPVKSQLSERLKWSTTLTDPSKDTSADIPAKSKGLNPSSPPFRSKQARHTLSPKSPPHHSRPPPITAQHPIGKKPMTPEDPPWEGSVSIVTKVIDDVFH
eukprot:TRINITY_DN30688_c0_g1_i1.p1 TRINITY_DN30688_c0_g1~~TRINITY_DN30688_c0_g1_i1.p1  ORF type:complete len:286 (+),score=37.05 TRINITY_DN30688_c0_g1_i1:26-859(+)